MLSASLVCLGTGAPRQRCKQRGRQQQSSRKLLRLVGLIYLVLVDASISNSTIAPCGEDRMDCIPDDASMQQKPGVLTSLAYRWHYCAIENPDAFVGLCRKCRGLHMIEISDSVVGLCHFIIISYCPAHRRQRFPSLIHGCFLESALTTFL